MIKIHLFRTVLKYWLLAVVVVIFAIAVLEEVAKKGALTNSEFLGLYKVRISPAIQ